MPSVAGEPGAERRGLVRIVLAELIDEGAVRTAGIVNDLRSFSRLGDAHFALIDVQDALEVTLRLLRPRWSGRAQNPVSRIPSGWNICASRYASRVWPDQISIRRPRMLVASL